MKSQYFFAKKFLFFRKFVLFGSIQCGKFSFNRGFFLFRFRFTAGVAFGNFTLAVSVYSSVAARSSVLFIRYSR